VLGDQPWLVVENLWWHGVDGMPGARSEYDVLASDTFSDREAPSPLVSLKARPRTAEQ